MYDKVAIAITLGTGITKTTVGRGKKVLNVPNVKQFSKKKIAYLCIFAGYDTLHFAH